MARMGRGGRVVVVVGLGRLGCDGGVVDTRFLFLVEHRVGLGCWKGIGFGYMQSTHGCST